LNLKKEKKGKERKKKNETLKAHGEIQRGFRGYPSTLIILAFNKDDTENVHPPMTNAMSFNALTYYLDHTRCLRLAKLNAQDELIIISSYY
jgi:hypothetical protein